MGEMQGIRYSHASQPIEATGAAFCPYSATDYAQFCSFKDKASTRIAGSDVSASVVVADRRFQNRRMLGNYRSDVAKTANRA